MLTSAGLKGLDIEPVNACPVSSAFSLGPEYARELQLLGGLSQPPQWHRPMSLPCRLPPAEGEAAIPYLQGPLPYFFPLPLIFHTRPDLVAMVIQKEMRLT